MSIEVLIDIGRELLLHIMTKDFSPVISVLLAIKKMPLKIDSIWITTAFGP